MRENKIEFCLPIKNEENILATNAGRLHDYLAESKPGYPWQIVLIVNGSDDASEMIAGELVKKDGGSFKLKVLPGGGKGHALREYFKESRADILVFMDVDLAVDMKNLPALIEPILSDKADLVIGSRLLPSSKTARSFWRGVISRSYNLLSRLVLGHPFSDLQCGFKAMKRPVFDALQPHLTDDHWFFDTELVAFALQGGRRVVEIPVDWQENRYDQRKSKIRVVFDVWPFVANLFRLRARLKKSKYLGSA